MRVGALVQRHPVQCLSDVSLDVVNFQRVQLVRFGGLEVDNELEWPAFVSLAEIIFTKAAPSIFRPCSLTISEARSTEAASHSA